MTRINTNVSSLITQINLNRSNASLETALTRLSTGLRINSGKDDPAGLIASENLRRDIATVEKAISNSERANRLIATADSALGQVSGLLNDIRSIVTEAASTGTLSDEQIAANQLQIDSSLEAINRIAQSTTFQGRRLLDGSLDFLVSARPSNIEDLSIQQASLGAAGQIDVDINISAAATQARLTTTVPDAETLAYSEGTLTFSDVAIQANSGTITLANGTLDITAVAGEQYDGEAGNLNVTFEIDALVTGAVAAINGNTIEVKVEDLTVTVQEIADAIEAIDDDANLADDFSVAVTGGAGLFDAADVLVTGALTGGVDAGDDVITVTATTAGAEFDGTITITEAPTTAAGTVDVEVDANNNITINLNNNYNYSLADIVTALDNLDDFDATFTTNDADGDFDTATDTATIVDLAGGQDAGGLIADLVLQISGKSGAEVLSFDAHSTLDQIAAAINLLSDSTGVAAENSSGVLELTSTDYGSKAFVDVEVISEGSGGTFASGLSGIRDAGTDIAASVNGIVATGDGNTLSINTALLDLSLTVSDGSSTDIDFSITGGGALFQLGPSVVTNQQASLGVGTLNTGKLGGPTGRLYELATGERASLTSDTRTAAKIVDEVIGKVTTLRGRLGAFQRTMLETSIASLSDTLVNLTDAESAIRDANFAAETAALTRSQILVQSGTSVLAIANQNPQNVLALLR